MKTENKIVIPRGEAHLPNPSINVAKRPIILAKRIRNITKRINRLQGNIAIKLAKKLSDYQAGLSNIQRTAR